MTWESFYLVCFLVGFGLSAISFLAGLHVPHVNLPHGLHVPHAPHIPQMPHGHGGIGGKGMRAGAGRGGISWFNFGTMSAFLAWFGGTGYLLERYYSVWFVLTLVIATLSGMGGAALIFLFLVKVLLRREAILDPVDYEMVGVLGKLSIPIRAGGTGELIYTQGGTRRVTGARSDDGAAIARGTEVMVTRYEKGIAYVRPWEDPAGELKA